MKYRISNLFAFTVMIVMNALANALPINGKTTGELSDQYPNLFVPAGITFSIWGVIYLLLLTVMAVQFFARYRDQMSSLGWTVTANFMLNGLWIVVWHYEKVVPSLIVMVALLATLVSINKTLKGKDGWLLRLAFGIYLGWICIATIANTTALLVTMSWDGFGVSQPTWTIIMILIGAGVGAGTMIRLQNPFLALAVVWGFYGIVLKRQLDYSLIAMFSYAGMIIVMAAVVYLIYNSRFNQVEKNT